MKEYQLVRSKASMLQRLMKEYKKRDPFKEALENSGKKSRSPQKEEFIKVKNLFKKVQFGLE
jgi:hypothetical protein